MTIQHDSRRQDPAATLQRVVRPLLTSLGLIEREEPLPSLSRWRKE